MGSTYSFQDVTATLVGPPAFNVDLGYGSSNSEEGITFSMVDDKNTMLIGADGGGMHSLHAGNAGTATVRLLKVSATNQKLMLAYTAQKVSSSLWGQNVLTLVNTASGDTFVCTQGAFKKLPDFTYAKDGDVIEWAFDFIRIDPLLGTY
jgi:hypothetical protein